MEAAQRSRGASRAVLQSRAGLVLLSMQAPGRAQPTHARRAPSASSWDVDVSASWMLLTHQSSINTNLLISIMGRLPGERCSQAGRRAPDSSPSSSASVSIKLTAAL